MGTSSLADLITSVSKTRIKGSRSAHKFSKASISSANGMEQMNYNFKCRRMIKTNRSNSNFPRRKEWFRISFEMLLFWFRISPGLVTPGKITRVEMMNSYRWKRNEFVLPLEPPSMWDNLALIIRDISSGSRIRRVHLFPRTRHAIKLTLKIETFSLFHSGKSHKRKTVHRPNISE